jgi:hypothetical protein
MRTVHPRRPAATLAALALLPILGGCFLDTGACDYEHRTLVLRGTIAGPLGVEVSLNETRGADPDFRVLNVQLTSGQFVGPGSSARLRDAGASPPVILAEWTTLSSNGEIWGANLDLGAGSPSHEMLATLARAGRLDLDVVTGLAGMPTERTGLLSAVTDGDWNHPRCD